MMEELIKEIENFGVVDISDFTAKKVKGNMKLGCPVEVHWWDRDNFDTGYSFALPGQDVAEGNFCLHMTNVDNSDGIGEGQEEWITLSALITFNRVKCVKFIN